MILKPVFLMKQYHPPLEFDRKALSGTKVMSLSAK